MTIVEALKKVPKDTSYPLSSFVLGDPVVYVRLIGPNPDDDDQIFFVTHIHPTQEKAIGVMWKQNFRFFIPISCLEEMGLKVDEEWTPKPLSKAREEV